MGAWNATGGSPPRTAARYSFHTMANITLDHVDAIHVLAAAVRARAMFDPPDAALALAAEDLAEAGSAATTVMTAAITAAMATRTTPRQRETDLDAAIADFITAINAQL